MNTSKTTQESEVDVLAVMDAEVVTMRRLECWVNEALTPTKLTADDAIARMEQARAAVTEVFEAIKVYREDYRQSGCPDPACIVCRRSKAAEDRLDTALRNAGVKV